MSREAAILNVGSQVVNRNCRLAPFLADELSNLLTPAPVIAFPFQPSRTPSPPPKYSPPICFLEILKTRRLSHLTMPEHPDDANASSIPQLPSSLPPTNPPSSTDSSLLQSCAPIVEELRQALTCPICLDLMDNARQLKCGHLFCAECLVRMLGMEKVRCAICKEKTSKRMVRDAPLPFDRIVATLRVLELCVAEKNPQTPNAVSSVNDGFDPTSTNAMARVQSATLQHLNKANAVIESDRPEESGPYGKICFLCPRGVDPISFGDEVSFGPLTAVASEKKKRSRFVHEQCALFSPEVYELNGVFHNVERVVLQSQKIVCARDACGRTRANIQCASPGCRKRFHFPCAVVENCVLVEDGFKMFCVAHKGQAPKITDTEFRKSLGDPNDAVSLRHDECCYLCNRGGRLLMCDTCSRVTHPVCSGLKGIPLGDWSCSVCTGGVIAGDGSQSNHQKKKKGATKVSKKRQRDPAESPEFAGNRRVSRGRAARASSNKKARKALGSVTKLALAHTGLQEFQREELAAIAKTRKTMVRSNVDRRVTHLIISARNRDEIPIRTMKLCRAIAARIPIICWKWVEESKACESWAPFEPHYHPLTWPKEENQIFQGFRFYFGTYNGPKEKKDDLSGLVVLGGGSVASREPSRDMMVRDEKMMYIKDDDPKENERREPASRGFSVSVTVVPSSWILDRCTKNRKNFPTSTTLTA